MMAELGDFAPGFNSFRRMLASVPETSRLPVFMNLCGEAAAYVKRGLSRANAADELYAIATAYGLDDPDAVQFIIKKAFSILDEDAGRPQGEFPKDEQQVNGHDKTTALDLVRPFPIDEHLIEPRPWIVPGLLLRRQVTVLVAPPASGKSLLTLQVAMMCATATSWGGWRPRGESNVMILNAEEDEDEMRRRLFAAQQVMQVRADKLERRLFLVKDLPLDKNRQPQRVIISKVDPRTKSQIASPMFGQLLKTVLDNRIGVVIADPFAETFEGDENSNSELKGAAIAWRDIARLGNCAVLLVHHTRKFATSDKMAGDMDAARGASALVGVARLVATLFTMTRDEQERFKSKVKSEDDRIRFIRFDDAKSNQNLITMKARWFEKQTFTLDNADGPNDLPSDDVGVLVPWEPPTDLLTDIETIDLLAVLEQGVLDDEGRPTGDPFTLNKSGRNNDRWAGLMFKEVRPQWSDKEIKTQLNRWITDTFLAEVDAPTSKSRGVKRKGLKVLRKPQPAAEAPIDDYADELV